MDLLSLRGGPPLLPAPSGRASSKHVTAAAIAAGAELGAGVHLVVEHGGALRRGARERHPGGPAIDLTLYGPRELLVATIRARWRAAARQHHPDRGAGDVEAFTHATETRDQALRYADRGVLVELAPGHGVSLPWPAAEVRIEARLTTPAPQWCRAARLLVTVSDA